MGFPGVRRAPCEPRELFLPTAAFNCCKPTKIIIHGVTLIFVFTWEEWRNTCGGDMIKPGITQMNAVGFRERGFVRMRRLCAFTASLVILLSPWVAPAGNDTADLLYQEAGELTEHPQSTEDLHVALEKYREALTMYEAAEQLEGTGRVLHQIGYIYSRLGEYEKAVNYYGRALSIARDVGDLRGQSSGLNNIGAVYRSWGKPEEAVSHYTEALKISVKAGDTSARARTLNNMGAVYNSQGKFDLALKNYEEALGLMKDVGDLWGEGAALNNIG